MQELGGVGVMREGDHKAQGGDGSAAIYVREIREGARQIRGEIGGLVRKRGAPQACGGVQQGRGWGLLQGA